ncbi:unnamed protein product [Tenebrio molitor]|nr:unnamed protein product [Tenebrio molitor]
MYGFLTARLFEVFTSSFFSNTTTLKIVFARRYTGESRWSVVMVRPSPTARTRMRHGVNPSAVPMRSKLS